MSKQINRWKKEFRKNIGRLKYLFIKDTNIYVISYPKAGRTWLRVMLDNFNKDIIYSHSYAAMIFPIHYKKLKFESFYKGKKVIFLTREPKDLIVSCYFQATNRINVFDGTISEFIKSDYFGIKKLKKFNDVWRKNLPNTSSHIVVNYEDLRKNTDFELTRILEFIDDTQLVNKEEISNAVKNASFNEMKKKEKSNKYIDSYGNKLKPADPNNDNSFKVRRGKIGGYVDYLDSADLDYINEIIG
jgi:hypothetical protein